MTCFVSVFRRQSVSVQMLIWSQTAGSRRRACAALHRASTTLPVCRREITLSAGETPTMEATPLQIIRKLCSCISHWELKEGLGWGALFFIILSGFGLWIFSINTHLHGKKLGLCTSMLDWFWYYHSILEENKWYFLLICSNEVEMLTCVYRLPVLGRFRSFLRTDT